MNHDNMLSQLALLTIAIIIPLTHAAETILGLYIFSRHGDRTSKATPPTLLTDFGYSEVFSSGTWFRNHYIANGSTSQIYGVAPDLVKQSQIAASAPLDNVLMPSCLGFLQGLYPPAGDTLGSQTLANGTVVKSPLNGYQIVPVSTVTSGTGSEDSAWLQGAGNCAKAIVSSNNYFSSQEYMDLLNTTKSFYQSLNPVVNSTFTADQNTFKNAYSSKCTRYSHPSQNPQANPPLPHSLRLPQCRFNPQPYHPLLHPPHPLHPPDPRLPSQRPRIRPRLQRQRAHPRHIRRHPRRASPRRSQRHHRYPSKTNPAYYHPVRRLQRLPILLRSGELDGPARRGGRLHGHPGLCVEHDV